jgi:hypothetical protein
MKLTVITTHRHSDRPLAERVAEISAQAEEQLPGPAQKRAALLRCDVCGVSVEIPVEGAELPDGWVSKPKGDYCPECSWPMT